ncbi:DUF1446 domain-containing protein [Nocardioides euryhalodurans]|uniref:DUF1446 domain-containing protein n=1 Tax=Nocardioides euryhalodurans TaxID=2518370 RepID=A0A4P7GNK5_9ACTN|nr:DUF1446 domain-containing protein [Nocardioides euryhalodurans]
MGVSVRLGAGAGFAGDRIDPAVDLVTHGDLDHLVFECLGERTVAAGHARRMADPATGHDPLLGRRLSAVLPTAHEKGTTIITNSGAANPVAGGELARRIADRAGVPSRIAVVTGDDVLEVVRDLDPVLWETGRPLSSETAELISANAYLGSDVIVEALETGADVVVAGRVADPSLYVAPLVHAHGWAADEWDRLGAGTMVGHLLECAGQLTGGYFADPVTQPVPGLARLGFPFADVDPDGSAVLGKTTTSGGRLDPRTCAAQLLYEVGDPGAYLTPDVTADFSAAQLVSAGPDRVALSGGAGTPRPEQLKVTVGFRDGWLGEGQISYAGPRAVARAELAAEVVRERLVTVHGLQEDTVTVELIGAGAAFRGWALARDAPEVRLRVSAHTPREEAAHAVGWEVESLYTNGPAGGGGARSTHHELVSIRSCLMPRVAVTPRVEVV